MSARWVRGGATAAALGLLVGCGVSLRDRPVTAITADTLGSHAICPGGRVPLRVVAELADGERLATRGPGQGDVRWDDYAVRVRGGRLHDGHLEVSEDPRETWARQALLAQVRSRYHDVAPVIVRVPVSYGCGYQVDARGEAGAVGAMGASGQRGMGGRDLPTGPGTPGGDGTDGQRGWRGGDGADGPRVWVGVTRVEDRAGRPHLAVSVQNGTDWRLFVLDVRGGSLLVDARGGDGGAGGMGGGGGDGGRGSPPGRAGAGGPGGDGGDGGRGGTVLVEVTPDAQPYLSRIRFDVRGGAAGNGGMHGTCGHPCRGSSYSGTPGRPGASGPAPEVRVVAALRDPVSLPPLAPDARSPAARSPATRSPATRPASPASARPPDDAAGRRLDDPQTR